MDNLKAPLKIAELIFRKVRNEISEEENTELQTWHLLLPPPPRHGTSDHQFTTDDHIEALPLSKPSEKTSAIPSMKPMSTTPSWMSSFSAVMCSMMPRPSGLNCANSNCRFLQTSARCGASPWHRQLHRCHLRVTNCTTGVAHNAG